MKNFYCGSHECLSKNGNASTLLVENTSTISLCKEPIQETCMKISEQTVVAFVDRFFCIYTKPINHGNKQSDNSDPKTSEKYADKIRTRKFIFSW